jgi:lysozyme
MADDFGGGLSAPLDISAQAINAMPDSSAPAIDNSGMLPTKMPTPQANPTQQFGSFLANMLPGAHYTAPDPASSALDQSLSLLQQRIDRASSIATNPIAQLFAPEQVQAARDFVPKATEQLRTIAQQKAQVQAGRAQAQSMGLTPDEAPDQATQDDRIQVAQAKALKGDMRSFQGLQAVAPDHAAAIAPQVYATVAGHLNNAQTAFDSLAGMTNEGQYRAKVNQLRQDGTLTDLESLGLKIPPSFDAFNSSKAAEGLALRNARIAINTTGQQLEDRNTYQPMAKDEAATYDGRLTTVYGDKVTNGSWSRNAASNTRGFVNNGLAVPDALGKGGTLGNADQRKQIGDEFAAAVPPKDLEKYRSFSRTYALATQDGKGNPIPSGGAVDPKTGRKTFINDNPNVQQGIAEGLASMLRGGTGGATSGLLNIEADKRGAVQSVFDKIQTAYAGTMNTLTGEQVRPYLTQLTEQQQRQVLDGLKGYTGSSITDRSLAVARRAGALGFGADALGLGKDEAGGSVNAAIEEGRQAQIARMRPNFQAIGGGDGVLQLGAQRPGASAIGLPPGAQPYNQLPGATPLLTPVQQASQNAPASSGGTAKPASPNPQPSGGAGPQLDPSLVTAVKGFEGFTPKAQWDYKQHSNGYGTKAQSPNETIDQPTADARLTSELGKAQASVDSFAPGLPEGARKALTSLTYNAGPGWMKAGLGDAVKSGDMDKAQSLLLQYNKAGGKEEPGLTARRQQEASWFDQPGGGSATSAPPAAAAPEAAYLTPKQREAMARRGIDTSASPRGPSPEQQAAMDADRRNVVGAAPAALGTLGAFGGGAVGGVPGAVAGGALGSGAGQALKDYVRGNAQSPAKIAEQAALGGVLGVASEARPLLAAAGRVAGSGAIEAGSTAAQGGSGPDVVDAAMRGGAEAAGGEAFGRALGMVGHKVFSLFSPDAKAGVQAAAKAYADSSKVLETELPKTPGVGGAAGTDNPKYTAAEAAQTKAEQTLKDAGLDPEEAAYAHKVSSEGVPLQEAQASKPGALEKQSIGAGYDQLRAEVGNAGVGAVKAAPKLPDGPIAAVDSKQVSAAHAELAQRTEMAITAPAANWQEKWGQLQDARSNLLQAERDAFSSTATGKTQTAADMRTLANTVRAQQAKAADYVFGPQQGPQVMQRLKMLDVRYRNLMEATNGGDLSQAAGLEGAAGREADQKFRAFAAGDPTAIAAWNAMRRSAGGPSYEKGIYNIMAVEKIPILGKVVTGARALGSLNKWMQERAAGSPAKFSDILSGLPDSGAQTARNIAGTVAQRGAVQGVGASP